MMLVVDDQTVRDALRKWSRTIRLVMLLIAANLAGGRLTVLTERI